MSLEAALCVYVCGHDCVGACERLSALLGFVVSRAVVWHEPERDRETLRRGELGEGSSATLGNVANPVADLALSGATQQGAAVVRLCARATALACWTIPKYSRSGYVALLNAEKRVCPTTCDAQRETGLAYDSGCRIARRREQAPARSSPILRPP